jgi:hypothetical protein
MAIIWLQSNSVCVCMRVHVCVCTPVAVLKDLVCDIEKLVEFGPCQDGAPGHLEHQCMSSETMVDL